MNKKLEYWAILIIVLVFGLGLAGCATWDGAVYSPPPQPPFNQENVAKGEFFFFNFHYTDSYDIEELCFLVNLGTFDPENNVYSLSSGERIIELNTTDVQDREIIVFPVKDPVKIIRQGQVVPFESVTWKEGGYYYLYNNVRFVSIHLLSDLSDEDSLLWGGQEIPKNEIIEGVKAAITLKYGWHMEEAQSAPSTDTLEKRSFSKSDREGLASWYYINNNYSRTGNLKGDTWYMLTNDARPGETFYIYSKKGILPTWDFYRKIK
jgi:hypothetical protein